MAISALRQTGIVDFESQIIFIVDYITDILSQIKMHLSSLLRTYRLACLITKSVRFLLMTVWIFYIAWSAPPNIVAYSSKNPKVLLFMIVELASSTCFSCILEGKPLEFAVYKPYLFDAIRQIIRSQSL